MSIDLRCLICEKDYIEIDTPLPIVGVVYACHCIKEKP